MSQDESDRKARSSRKLPSSGLAEDILGKSSPTSGGVRAAVKKRRQSRTSAKKKQRDKQEEAPAPARPREPELREAEQIYAFADDLEAAQAAETTVREETPEPYVTFRLAEEYYALPVSHVQEVLKVTPITRVPHSPPTVRGVMNRRGGVLPVVDLRVRFGLEKTEIVAASRVLVVLARRRLIGLLVDAVFQVTQLKPSHIEEAPSDVAMEQSDCVQGVYQADSGLLIVLNVERTLEVRATA